jgi:hypothetical protein
MSIYSYVSNFTSLQIILPTFGQYLFFNCLSHTYNQSYFKAFYLDNIVTHVH